MAKKKRRNPISKKVSNQFQSKIEWNKYKLRPGSQKYNNKIKKVFGIAKNTFYEDMPEQERSERISRELASPTSAKTYDEYTERQSAYAKALKKLSHESDFMRGSHEERIQMLIETEPSLASALTSDGKLLDLSMTMLAYEDRERLINTGEYAVRRAKQYIDNYRKAISETNMPVPKDILNRMSSVDDNDLVYFIDALLPQLPDWYGMNGSTLMPAIDFIQKLQEAVDYYETQKGQQSK